VHVGFCEKADGKYFNTALLTDRDGRAQVLDRVARMERLIDQALEEVLKSGDGADPSSASAPASLTTAAT